MIKKTNIAFDIDGVVINFTDPFLQTAKEKFGLLKDAKFSDVNRYQFHECLNISCDDCSEIINYVITNPFICNVGPVEDAVKILTDLSKHIDLVFITARQSKFETSTKELIHFILPDVDKDKIIIIHQKGSEKYQVLNDLNIEYFIDDRSKNVRALNKKGIKVYLFTRPWNFRTRPDDSFVRISNWKEISDLVGEIQNG